MPSDVGISAYPMENILRDVAGELLADYLRRQVMPGIGDLAWARLIGRAQEVNRHDLIPKIVNDGVPTTAALSGLVSQAIKLRAELIDHCRQAPVPTIEAYEAVCATLERTKRAAAEDASRAGREALDAFRDEHHRPNDRAPGYCICGDIWETTGYPLDPGSGCEEYQSITEYSWKPGEGQ